MSAGFSAKSTLEECAPMKVVHAYQLIAHEVVMILGFEGE
jgi:hypothetical protein